MEYNHSRSSIPSYNDKFNIMIIGDDNVGKTSILEKFCNGLLSQLFSLQKKLNTITKSIVMREIFSYLNYGIQYHIINSKKSQKRFMKNQIAL